MSAAIYQRTRPIHWDEVVGQEHVKDVLRPALERGRIGHAYLFSGPRGVGKTTTARLIAMTVNCDDNSGTVKPCGKCESCRMVMAGRHPDVLEIDAASNNSVDDVRDLREKVALQPMRGDKKVYILDEAHMMSKSAFNALLKTLEEPPSHAVFILATTEPERLPPTILSRCQHYRFRRLSVAEIAGKLEKTCVAEGVTAAPEALNLIARSADGAMRDGESLLERMLAAGEPALTLSSVEGALGLPPQDRLKALALALTSADSATVLSGLNALYSDGFAPRTITERVKIALRDALHEALNVDGARSKGSRDDHHDLEPGLLLKLIRALDEEDARFARSSDLIALEMAFTKALVAVQSGGASSDGGDSGLATRVAALERQMRDGGARPTPRANVPDFDPTSRARPTPTRAEPPRATASEPAALPIAVPEDDDREPAPNRAFVAEHESRQAPSSPTRAPASAPRAAASGKTWGDVVLKAGPQMKAFLKEAVVQQTSTSVVLSYGTKHKFHADGIAAKLADVDALVRQILGDHVLLELVMPDGSKKNPPGSLNRASVPAVSAPTVGAPQPVAVVLEAVKETVRTSVAVLEPVETAPEPAPRVSSLSVTPNAEIASSHVQSARSVASNPAVPSSIAPVSSPPAPHAALETLAFQQLGQDDPEPNLFAADQPTLLSEPAPEALPLEPVTAPDDLELGTPDFGSLEPSVVEAEPLPFDPRSADAPEINLETVDLGGAGDAGGLAALELDFGDIAAPVRPRGPSAPASLTGHPNYALLAKLFAHRVVGAGRFEAKPASTEDAAPTIAATTSAAAPAPEDLE
jgi:DNA polymerase-3 subunit gamma/tau